ncbi:hypothetical protein T02_3731 [Trichinella nativa]|uniref:Uncharacterized protein n=1 Tax=Trichinella nativa TaxID=6335 RepID=A0A0V1L5G0_9BILA|nr:hypothetical protein T02_3731 [Trichinella nativa]
MIRSFYLKFVSDGIYLIGIFQINKLIQGKIYICGLNVTYFWAIQSTNCLMLIIYESVQLRSTTSKLFNVCTSATIPFSEP